MCLLVWSMQVVSLSQRNAEVMRELLCLGARLELVDYGSVVEYQGGCGISCPQESSLLTGMYDWGQWGRGMGYAQGIGHRDWDVQL